MGCPRGGSGLKCRESNFGKPKLDKSWNTRSSTKEAEAKAAAMWRRAMAVDRLSALLLMRILGNENSVQLCHC